MYTGAKKRCIVEFGFNEECCGQMYTSPSARSSFGPLGRTRLLLWSWNIGVAIEPTEQCAIRYAKRGRYRFQIAAMCNQSVSNSLRFLCVRVAMGFV